MIYLQHVGNCGGLTESEWKVCERVGGLSRGNNLIDEKLQRSADRFLPKKVGRTKRHTLIGTKLLAERYSDSKDWAVLSCWMIVIWMFQTSRNCPPTTWGYK